MGSLNKCEIIDGQKVLTPFVETNNGIINGMPLGSWISFEKNVAPNEEWIQAGTTFDADKYPELYLFLGSNVVPERYDHSRFGTYQSITLPTTSATAMTMPYDGVLLYVPRSSSNIAYVYINGTTIYADGGDSGAQSTATINFKAGDIIYASLNGSQYSKVAYYDKPLFIKASSATSIYTPSDAVRQVKDYVADYVDLKCPNIFDYDVLTLVEPAGVANNTPYSYTATKDCFFSASQNWNGSSTAAKGVKIIMSNSNGDEGEVIDFYPPVSKYGSGTSETAIRNAPSVMSKPIFLEAGRKIWYRWANYDNSNAVNAKLRIYTTD